MNKFIGLKGYNARRDVFDAPSVYLRRSFTLENIPEKAEISLIGLGLGVYYINGHKITDDVFTTPVSDYGKSLWYSTYDVTSLLCKGRNVIFAELGNGFYNEGISTTWDIDKASWRGEPCLWLSLIADGREIVSSDESWKVQKSRHIYFNELRLGEYVDSHYDSDELLNNDYDDSSWDNASFDVRQPSGVLRECDVQPIRETDRIKPVKTVKTDEGYLFDFGINISGYVELSVENNDGAVVEIRSAEAIDENNHLQLSGLDCYYNGLPFQVDKLICKDGISHFKPKFTYHGFRYVLVTNTEKVPEITAVFVHQDVKLRTTLRTSNELINKIYEAGIRSVYSNMFYSLTDCPTREKLGWLNDAQASAEHILLNFDSEKFFARWYEDIKEAFNDAGNLPGIVPSHGWGYEYGPVCSGLVFTLPYLLYKYDNDADTFLNGLPAMERYLTFHKSHMDEFLLADWRGCDSSSMPKDLIAYSYLMIFGYILSYGYSLKGDSVKSELYKKDIETGRAYINEHYLNEDGSASLNDQSSVSCLIMLGFGNIDKLSAQLVKSLEDTDYHIDVGMYGIQFLYKALSKIDRNDLVMKMISNETRPSFRYWFDNGATTLWETFKDKETWSLSRNHHMLSNILYWFISDVAGLRLLDGATDSYEYVDNYVPDIDDVDFSISFRGGLIRITKTKENVILERTGNAHLYYKGAEIDGYLKIEK